MKRTVISGATGAVGMALIKKCIEEEAEVLVLCRKGSARAGRIPNHPLVQTLEVDLADYQALENSNRKTWGVFYHLAWLGTTGESRDDALLQMQNVIYTLEAVRLAKRLGCHTFVGAGSQAEYGRFEGCLKGNTPTFPETGYGIAKLAAGQMSRLLCKQLGMKHIWTRILSVYGPYDGEQSMVMSSVIKLLRGEIPAFTKGDQLWDYLYSRDAANALWLLGEKGKDGKIYCLGSGTAKPLKEYILQIRDAAAPGSELEFGVVPYTGKQVMHLCADIRDLQEDVGFYPEVSFAEGIRETVAFAKRIEKL